MRINGPASSMCSFNFEPLICFIYFIKKKYLIPLTQYMMGYTQHSPAQVAWWPTVLLWLDAFFCLFGIVGVAYLQWRGGSFHIKKTLLGRKLQGGAFNKRVNEGRTIGLGLHGIFACPLVVCPILLSPRKNRRKKLPTWSIIPCLPHG